MSLPVDHVKRDMMWEIGCYRSGFYSDSCTKERDTILTVSLVTEQPYCVHSFIICAPPPTHPPPRTR